MPSHDGRTDARLDEASANGTKIDGPWRVRSDHCAAAAATTEDLYCGESRIVETNPLSQLSAKPMQ